MTFDKESKSDYYFVVGGAGAGACVLKPKQYARLSNELKYKKTPSTQCGIGRTINISKYVNNCLSTNRATLNYEFSSK